MQNWSYQRPGLGLRFLHIKRLGSVLKARPVPLLNHAMRPESDYNKSHCYLLQPMRNARMGDQRAYTADTLTVWASFDLSLGNRIRSSRINVCTAVSCIGFGSHLPAGRRLELPHSVYALKCVSSFGAVSATLSCFLDSNEPVVPPSRGSQLGYKNTLSFV